MLPTTCVTENQAIIFYVTDEELVFSFDFTKKEEKKTGSGKRS
jgi:hypothetical protein